MSPSCVFLSVVIFIVSTLYSLPSFSDKLAVDWDANIEHGKVLKHRLFHSKITGLSYPYHVYLPVAYSSNSKSYPVIYATDAQWVFNMFAEEADLHSLELIIIGIEEGPRFSKRRNVDYSFPGQLDYLHFLTKEFIPVIEAEYRIDSNNRSLQGLSLGGSFVVSALFSPRGEGSYFKNYLSFDAPFQYQSKELNELIKAHYQKQSKFDARLFLTSASKGNARAVQSFSQWLNGLGFNGLDIEYKDFDAEHNEISNYSLPWVLERL
ncbi:alpha/beta hydrolase [Agaribacterium sp. ZY112]|uniref:alpha/beta hydrolase n=1 Tax=Agaribacterium sp. ZY112 TaxID=3233574 RepID=UPI003525B119